MYPLSNNILNFHCDPGTKLNLLLKTDIATNATNITTNQLQISLSHLKYSHVNIVMQIQSCK